MTEALQIISYNGFAINDGIAYVAYFPDNAVRTVLSNAATPVVRADRVEQHPATAGINRAGRDFQVEVQFLTGNRETILQLFDPENGLTGILECQSLASGETVVMYVTCSSVRDVETDEVFALRAFLTSNGDVYWRRKNKTGVIAPVNSGNYTWAMDNFGDMDGYPEFTLTINAPKSNDFSYKEFVETRNTSFYRARNYPVDIMDGAWDTATLVAGGKMQATGADIRVYVNGVEIPYVINGINTANTRLWIPLDFEPPQQFVLRDAIAPGDTPETIDLLFTSSNDINAIPNAGLIRINNEVFAYTDKNNALSRLLGVTRAQKNTTAGNHLANADVFWIQNDINVLYGNSTAIAPSYTWSPTFAVSTSTNSNWRWELAAVFGGTNQDYAASWIFNNQIATEGYTAPGPGSADPATVAGVQVPLLTQNPDRAIGTYTIYNPFIIANFQVTTGNRGWSTGGAYSGTDYGQHVYFAFDNVSELVTPTWAGVTWTYNGSGTLTSRNTCGVAVSFTNSQNPAERIVLTNIDVQVCNITVGFPPVNWRTGEQANYLLDAQIINETTGESISVNYTTAVGNTIVIDCDNYTITDNANGSSQLQMLEIVEGARKRWLRLVPGNNSWRYIDTGTTDVSLQVVFQSRFYV